MTDCGETTDADGDGVVAVECGGGDCDDSDLNRYPGNAEVCDTEGHDEDCDPETFGFRDSDGDTYPDSRCCNVTEEGEFCGTDCNDMQPAQHPGEAESCDLLDNDCDGSVDEGAVRMFYPDTDGDSFGDGSATPMNGCTPPEGWVENNTDCDDTNENVSPGVGDLCDGIDNNCNGVLEGMVGGILEDADGDGDWSGCGFTTNADCDDTNPSVFRGALEACDGLDNDCDGLFDGEGEDDDLDGFADMSCGGDDCNDDDPLFFPGADEVCDGRDTNCDGSPTIADSDGDGRGASSCGGDDCDDSNDTVYAGAPELCDGLDNDCNGLLDGPGEDDDSDGFGDMICGGSDCNDADEDFYPGAPEGCDGIDYNCDGVMNASDDDGDGFGDVSCGGTDCDDTRSTVNPDGMEVCNGIDDDCNGVVDGPVLDCAGTLPWCSGRTGRCVDERPCGDGILHAGEECDDGNVTSLDGCNDSCSREVRLLSPISGSFTTTTSVLLEWQVPDGIDAEVVVERCPTRACSSPVVIGTTSSSQLAWTAPQGSHLWRVVRRDVGGGLISASRTWTLQVLSSTPGAALSFGTVPDVNGDALADVVINEERDSNSVAVYLGALGGPSAPAHQVLLMPTGYDRYGGYVNGVYSAGDVNGDGFSDILVRAERTPFMSQPESAILHFGSPAGLGPAVDLVSSTASGSGRLHMIGVGDLDHDGYGDVVVSDYDDGGVGVRVLFGGELFPARTQSIGDPGSGEPSFGSRLVAVGDVNRDGMADIAVGGFGMEPIYLFMGSTAGVDTSSPVTLAPPELPFINGVGSVGDANGDGFCDIAVHGFTSAAPPFTRAAYLYLGSTTGVVSTAVELPLSSGGVNSMNGAADVDDDGFGDFVLLQNSGGPVLYLGGSDPMAIIPGPSTGTSRASPVGDANGDGYPDLVGFDFDSLQLLFIPGSSAGLTAPTAIVSATEYGVAAQLMQTPF